MRENIVELTKQQIKLLNELKIRYDCVRVDIVVNDNPNRLSNKGYGELINKRLEQERKAFSAKHNLTPDEVIEMERAYNELEDIEEYHQYVDYYKVCDYVFYRKLRTIIQREVYIESCSLAKSFVPQIMVSNAYQKQKNEIEKRLTRCEKVLIKHVPRMTLYKYENIKYRLQYRMDYRELNPNDYEEEMVRELCQYALTEDYFASFFKRVINKYLFS